jgi:hypothetical protein
VVVAVDLVLLVVLQIHKLLLDQVVVKVVVDLVLTPLIIRVLEVNQEHHKIFLHLVIHSMVILEELQITQHPMLVVVVAVPVVLVDQVMAMVIVETVV